MMTEGTLEIKDNEFLRQFELDIEGDIAKIEYAQQERKIFLTKLVMSDALREKEMVEPFLKAVFDIIAERNTRIVPSSPEIAKFMKKHKRKYRDLLPIGINI